MNEQDLLKRIEDLETWKKSLESSSSIPLPIDQSFRTRFQEIFESVVAFNGFTIQFTTPDDGPLEAAGAPDILLKAVIKGKKYLIPAYIPLPTSIS